MMTRSIPPRFATALAAVTLLSACGGFDSPGLNAEPIQIQSLSNRADLISGGSALIEIQLPAGADGATLKVELNGQDVSAAFIKASDTTRQGLVSGLANGHNVIAAQVSGAQAQGTNRESHVGVYRSGFGRTCAAGIDEHIHGNHVGFRLI